MDKRDIIQQSIDYIEENLKTDLTAKELSNLAGFSLFHYYRLFHAVMGTPVMQYILRRRVINAIYEISQGGKMVDIALSYGFDTHAGFFKAFKREYHCSPSYYLKNYKSCKPYKINIKQEVPIMVTDKKLAEILKHWGLEHEQISHIYNKNTGSKQDNVFYVGEKFVIKATSHLGALKNHIALSKALEKAHLAAATPITTTTNQEYVMEGDLYFLLTKRIDGDCMQSGEIYLGDYTEKARYLGKIIGQLHGVLKSCDDILCTDANLFQSVTAWALPKVKCSMPLPEEFGSDYIKVFGKLYAQLPTQIIHRDPNPGNIIFANGQLTGFIDFELSEKNIRLFDPCYAATAILSESFSENDMDKLNKWTEIYQNIIYGYDSVVKLTSEEKSALPYVVLSIQLTCVAYFSEKDKFAQLAAINKKMLTWLIEHKDSLAMGEF